MAPILAADAGGAFYAATSLLPCLLLLAALPLSLLAAARGQGVILRVLDTSRRMPWRSFGTGTLFALAFLLLATASKLGPLFGLLFAAALLCMAALALFGLAAEARALGCELRGADPHVPGPAAAPAAVGWLVLAGLPLAVLAGPLVLLFLLLRSTGATLIAAVAKE